MSLSGGPSRLPAKTHWLSSTLTRHPGTTVRFVPVDLRPNRNYAVSVMGTVPFGRLVVVALDLADVGCLPEARVGVQVTRVRPQVPVIAQPPDVAVEHLVVDGVEPGQCRVKPDVSLGQQGAEQEAAPGQPFVERVEGREEALNGLFVAGLCGRQAGLVNTGVDGVEDQR